MEALKASTDTLFILLGAVMVLAMHAGFAFLELGTVRRKNQVNALMKILVDFAVSTIAYFFIGYAIAYGTTFFAGAPVARRAQRLRAGALLLPAHLRRGHPGDRVGRHRRARALRSAARRDVRAGRLVYPFFEGIAWNGRFGVQDWLKQRTSGAEFHDFAGSVVVHAVGGWIGARGGAAARRAARPLRPRRSASARIRRRPFRSWRSAHGCCASAGSAST